MKTNKSYKDSKIEYIQHMYGAAYEDFLAENPRDDRRVYINTYDIIMNALNSLPKDTNNYVCCAMNHMMDNDFELMTRIGKRFGRTEYIFTESVEE